MPVFCYVKDCYSLKYPALVQFFYFYFYFLLEILLCYFTSQLKELQHFCYTNMPQAFVLVTVLLLVKHPMAADRKRLIVEIRYVAGLPACQFAFQIPAVGYQVTFFFKSVT